MDAQTLAKTIKRRTKSGEWWAWKKIGSVSDARYTLLSWGWLERKTLRQDDPMRRNAGAQFAYRWTESVVGRV
jgi:hypothetical protein